MSSDIKLEEDSIILEGNAIYVRGSDLLLDQILRRPGTNPTSFRRALVHNDHDGLTINFNGDYPNGVTIQGNLEVDTVHAKYLHIGTIPSSQLIISDLRVGSIGVNAIYYRRKVGDSEKIVNLIDEVHALQSRAYLQQGDTLLVGPSPNSVPMSDPSEIGQETQQIQIRANEIVCQTFVKVPAGVSPDGSMLINQVTKEAIGLVDTIRQLSADVAALKAEVEELRKK